MTHPPIISSATHRNWAKLNTDSSHKLTARANKQRSRKTIVPLEYFSDSRNAQWIADLKTIVRKHRLSLRDTLLTIASMLLERKGILNKDSVRSVLQSYPFTWKPELAKLIIPDNEKDILGLIYQCLLLEGEKSFHGSYYTPDDIVQDMLAGCDFTHQQTFLDPCCGSGAFLLSVPCSHPDQLFGIDKDRIAVMLAKINLLLRFPDIDFIPQIICLDYLKHQGMTARKPDFLRRQFDFIITNPPWGACTATRQQDTFSRFYMTAFEQLKPTGTIHFLFPEAILTIRTHADIRQFMLEHGAIDSITTYSRSFTGVVTRYVDIKCVKAPQQETVTITHKSQQQFTVPVSRFTSAPNFYFSIISNEDNELMDYLQTHGTYSLENSKWALGIVTGDNKSKLKDTQEYDCEPIYTGREIAPYRLKPARFYIHYDRQNLQQVAKDEFYRADEKLIYKFISKKLVFAYDNTKSLFLNSANILIPNIPNMTAKTVLAFLNSDVFSFFYRLSFNDVKILQGNLMQLPFPTISSDTNQLIDDAVTQILNGSASQIPSLQTILYRCFALNRSQIQRIASF